MFGMTAYSMLTACDYRANSTHALTTTPQQTNCVVCKQGCDQLHGAQAQRDQPCIKEGYALSLSSIFNHGMQSKCNPDCVSETWTCPSYKASTAPMLGFASHQLRHQLSLTGPFFKTNRKLKVKVIQKQQSERCK
jgi:hypothetical protein